ncbi:MBL fold metallo-hydrolase [Nocardioides sp. Bht2]|uniref:MBL fold metallo-hydrolase n=1 Tax=Nocardioides sp. Bht2 TaxID=3392297 RepID=UPI0039B4BB70
MSTPAAVPPAISRRVLLRGTAGAVGVAAAIVSTGRAAQAAPLGSAAPSARRRRMIRARQRFFGTRMVNPRTGALSADRLVVSWLGCTTYAVAFGGRVLLLDAWLPRGAHEGRVPTAVTEVAALAPSAIFVGHGHFDHARDVGDLARLSGATVVGTKEHCALAQELAGVPIRTRALGAEADPLGTVHRFRTVGLNVTAIRHPHSSPRMPDLSDPHLPLLPLPDLSAALSHPTSLGTIFDTLGHANDPEGGALLYQFRYRGFRLLWNNSIGPVKELAPSVPTAIAALPRSDVHLCAIQGFGQITNGMRDVGTYAAAARARLLVPGHHDDWGVPVIATQASPYRTPLEEELAKIPARRRPKLRWMTDPEDYLRPERLTFRI